MLGNGGYDSIRLEDVRIFVRDDLVRLLSKTRNPLRDMPAEVPSLAGTHEPWPQQS